MSIIGVGFGVSKALRNTSRSSLPACRNFTTAVSAQRSMKRLPVLDRRRGSIRRLFTRRKLDQAQLRMVGTRSDKLGVSATWACFLACSQTCCNPASVVIS